MTKKLFITIMIVLIIGVFVYLILIKDKAWISKKTDGEIVIKETDGHSQIIRGHSSNKESVKVSIVHDKSNPHSFNEDFIITGDTHIIVSLMYSPYTDYPSEIILSRDFTDIAGLPFLLEITGELDKTFKSHDYYHLYAKVFNHLGSEPTFGDLVSEIYTPIKASDDSVEIRVFGLEDCSDPNAGGFCSSE